MIRTECETTETPYTYGADNNGCNNEWIVPNSSSSFEQFLQFRGATRPIPVFDAQKINTSEVGEVRP